MVLRFRYSKKTTTEGLKRESSLNTSPEGTSIKLSIAKPTSEMLPASALKQPLSTSLTVCHRHGVFRL
jgi:hypothetical protein